MTTVIFPLSGHPNWTFLKDINHPILDIKYVDIPITTWISLFENKFIGIHDSEFFKSKYKISYSEEVVDFINQLNTCILDFDLVVILIYRPHLSLQLWAKLESIFKQIPNVQLVGICLQTNITSKYIIKIPNDNLNCKYTQDFVFKYLNMFFLKTM